MRKEKRTNVLYHFYVADVCCVSKQFRLTRIPVSFQMSTHTQEMYTQEQPTLNAICQCSCAHIQPGRRFTSVQCFHVHPKNVCHLSLKEKTRLSLRYSLLKKQNGFYLSSSLFFVLVDNMSANLLGVATRQGNLSLHQLQLIMSQYTVSVIAILSHLEH